MLPENVLLAIWQAHVPTASFHPTWGIEKAWSEDPYRFGPALTESELVGKDKLHYRPFAHACIKWDPAKGAIIIGPKQ
jgi:hypothetical protein